MDIPKKYYTDLMNVFPAGSEITIISADAGDDGKISHFCGTRASVMQGGSIRKVSMLDFNISDETFAETRIIDFVSLSTTAGYIPGYTERLINEMFKRNGSGNSITIDVDLTNVARRMVPFSDDYRLDTVMRMLTGDKVSYHMLTETDVAMMFLEYLLQHCHIKRMTSTGVQDADGCFFRGTSRGTVKYVQARPFTDIVHVVEHNSGMRRDEFFRNAGTPRIKNMDEAASFIKDYFSRNPDGEVTCIGDYDVDGLIGASIIWWGFREMGHDVRIRIPRRMSEGYGLSEKITDEISRGLVITVDNGITAVDAVTSAKDRGISVIIIDHHLPIKDPYGKVLLPPADVIVDPHIETQSGYRDSCGAALAFYLMKELLPDGCPDSLAVLASIATVADMVPLIGANRTLVENGLSLINGGAGVPGLRELVEMKNLSSITEDDYGYVIGPVLNAPGRLFDDGGTRVIDLLTTEEAGFPLTWQAEDIIRMNNSRKELMEKGFALAETLITGDGPIVIFHPSFGEGIVGLIAGRLTEKYNTPSVVFTTGVDGNYKGSARSPGNVHLKNALDRIKDTMTKYGGHAGAAGITVPRGGLDLFREAFMAATGNCGRGYGNMEYDLDIMEEDIPRMADETGRYAPYGTGNPKIRFHAVLNTEKGRRSITGNGKHFRISMPDYEVVGFGLAGKFNTEGRPSVIECIFALSRRRRRNGWKTVLEIMDFTSVGDPLETEHAMP